MGGGVEQPNAVWGNPQLVRYHLLRSNQSALQIEEVDSASRAKNHARVSSLDECLGYVCIIDAHEVPIALCGEETP
jgi:hypothetical protein